MNFKIIETSVLMPDVLLYRDREESGKEEVKIMAIGIVGSDEDMFAIETVQFDTCEMAKRYINDFSQKSAELWCQKENITYQ